MPRNNPEDGRISVQPLCKPTISRLYQHFNKCLSHLSNVTYLQCSIFHCAVERQRQASPAHSVRVQNASLRTDHKMVLVGFSYPPQVVHVLRLYHSRHSFCAETIISRNGFNRLHLKRTVHVELKADWSWSVVGGILLIKLHHLEDKYADVKLGLSSYGKNKVWIVCELLRVTFEWRRLKNEELQKVHPSPYMNWMIKSGSMRLTGNVAPIMKKSDEYKVLA
jgi:hypothetical protein